jgi:HEAT repeat protein
MRATFAGFFLLIGLFVVGCNGEPSTVDVSKLPPPVNAVLQSKDSNSSQRAASDALGRIGSPAVPALTESLSDPSPIVRLQTCRALAYMGVQAKDAVPALTQALNDSEQGVREAAAAALGQVGIPATPAIPELMKMLRGQKQ